MLESNLMQSVGTLLAASGAKDDPDYGYKWRVQVVAYGLGRDGRINWPREPLVAAIKLYDGARVFALNDSQHQATQKPFGKSVREIVGWLKSPEDTGAGIEADLFILKSAKWLRDGLMDSHDRGMPTLFGLSHDVTARAVTKTVAGKRIREPVEITAVEVDVVYDPTNNGKFLRLAAAGAAKEEAMKEKLLAALKKARPDLFTQVNQETVTEDELVEMLAAQRDEGQKDQGDMDARIQAAVAKALEGHEPQVDPNAAEALKQTQLLAASITLRDELAASKLPEVAQVKLRKRFENQVVAVDVLRAAIKEEKEMIDALTGSGNIHDAGHIRAGLDSQDKLQAACDRMLGVRVDDKLKEIAPFKSLRAAYVELTGDVDVRGYLDPAAVQRMQAANGTATFTYVLGNTLYRRMCQDYREISDYGVGRLVGPNIRNARDFRTMESVRIGYYGDLPDVSTETANYPELAELTDEEISYALNQKGGIVTITRVMIINDDLRAVQKILSRIPRSARRTLAKRCWGKFINNNTYKGDSKAVFHADHANLGTAAYAVATALAAKTAFAQQTEPGSGARLMLRPVTVVFPAELFGIVKTVNTWRPATDDATVGNPMYGFFQDAGLIENPFMTDANDWMMFGDPNDAEILELAFLNGQQEPEMFVADLPTQGQMFVGDRVQYKVRHEYECEILDYRNAYKAVVV